MKILGAVLELPSKQHCQSSPFGPNWPNWQCCLAGSSKTAPRIFIFFNSMGADYSFYVKTIETHACTFLTLNILAIGIVRLAGRPAKLNLLVDNVLFLTKFQPLKRCFIKSKNIFNDLFKVIKRIVQKIKTKKNSSISQLELKS